MKKVLILFVSIMLISSVSFAQSDITGTWNGILQVSGIELRLTFNISDSAGVLKSTMDSPDQNAYDIPMDSTFFSGDTLKVIATALRGDYLGIVQPDGINMVGTWTQGGMAMKLDMQKGEKEVLNRPQEPMPPYPYNEEEVSCFNPIDSNTLVGTLTIPKEGGPFTAVLMITGSGAQDRDEMIFAHKPFKVIADHLTRKGIAVLRVDDRGFGESTGDIINATTENFVGDVAAGVDYLKSREDIDKVGLIGHSEGGIIAPWLATERDDIAFVVMLAGTGVKGDVLINAQIEAVLDETGKDSTYIRETLELQNIGYGIMRAEPDADAFRTKYFEAMEKWKKTIGESHRLSIDSTTDSEWEMAIRQAGSAWFRFFIDYDPYPPLTKIKCPVLSMIGTKDIQVPYLLNSPLIEQALKEGGNKNYKVVNLENLNHLFQNCKTGAVSEYGEIKETFAPSALELMSGWILEVTK